MRLIDADAFDRDLCNKKFTAALNEAADAGTAFKDREMYYSTQSFRDVMKYRPTIDAVQVVHALWEWLSCTYDRTPSEMRCRCSKCHHETITHDRGPWEKYCPNCGAKMDLEGTDADKT